MKISRIMSISKILIDLCAMRQIIRIGNTFAYIDYNVLVVKSLARTQKSFFWR